MSEPSSSLREIIREALSDIFLQRISVNADEYIVQQIEKRYIPSDAVVDAAMDKELESNDLATETRNIVQAAIQQACREDE